MISIVLIVFSAIATAFGISDLSNPKAIIDFINTLPFGKYTYATHWSLIISLCTTLLYLVCIKLKFKVLNLLLRFLLTISLPLSIFVALFFWILFIRNPTNFRESATMKLNVYTPFITNLSQHLFPLIGLVLIWYRIPILTASKCHLLVSAVSLSYTFATIYGYKIAGRWPYPFMNGMRMHYIAGLFIATTLIMATIYELLRTVEKIRKRRGMRKLAGPSKNKFV